LADERILPGTLCSVIAVLLSIGLFVALTAKGGRPIAIYDNGIGDHWPPNHRNLTIVDRTGDPTWHQSISDAVTTWAAGGSAINFTLTTASGDCVQRRDHIEICQASTDAISRQGSAGEQGLFVPFLGSGNTYKSAILLFCSNCEIDRDRMNVVATHELGHALGLAHSPDPDSVMYYLGGSTQPDARDYQILRFLEGVAPPAT
jgi:predicted Zn-dependent protease